jgi:hypothetical protein
MGRECSMHGRDEKCIHNFGQKVEGKRPVRRPRCILKDNFRLDLREIGWGVVDLIHLAKNMDQ